MLHDAAAVRMGWKDPYEWSGLLCLYEEPSRPVTGHHLMEGVTGPPTSSGVHYQCYWSLLRI